MPLTLPTDNLVGKTIAGCRILERIGRGSMGVVYRGLQLHVMRAAAVKVVPAGTPRASNRLAAEARAVAKVDHPNVVRVYDLDIHEGHLVVVMELVEGASLRCLFDTAGPLLEDDLVAVGAGIGRGLSAIHDAGLVHRDLKMDNVLLTSQGVPKIVDCGLAWRGGSKDDFEGCVVGTPAYMAPEQWIARVVDQRSDLYALGVLLYAAATGTFPFRGSTDELKRQHLSREPRSPQECNRRLDDGLSAVILKLLAKDPARRYAGARAFLADWTNYRNGPEALVESGAVRCGFCDALNDAGEERCRTCKEPLGPEPVLEIALAQDESFCGGCGRICRKASPVCPSCGGALCVKCGKPRTEAALYCTGCLRKKR